MAKWLPPSRFACEFKFHVAASWVHDVQVFGFLSGSFTLLTNLTWFAPTHLHFSRLCFDQLCTRSAHDDKKRRVLKIHCVRLKMKHSSSWLFYRTKWGQKERGDMSRGKTIKGSVGETQRFPFLFGETPCILAVSKVATEVETGSTFGFHWIWTQWTTQL